MNYLLLMMGGSGTRTTNPTPKQFIIVDCFPIFYYILDKYLRLPFIDGAVVVANPDWLQFTEEWCGRCDSQKMLRIVAGGANRSLSIRNGLSTLRPFAEEESVVLLHDATHPYVDEDGTKTVIEAVRKNGGATLASFNYDTTYSIDDDGVVTEVLRRDRIINGASPEGFRFGLIDPIYANSSTEELAAMASAGAMALAHNIPLASIPTDIFNLKITFAHDLELFKKLKSYFF